MADAENLSALETEVFLRLRKYRVQKHYRASSDAKATRYAVFHNGKQITDAKPFAEAHSERDTLTAKEIVAALLSSMLEVIRG